MNRTFLSTASSWRLTLAIVFALLGTRLSIASDRDPRHDFFENKIRPLLVQHCYECHGEGESEAGLQLDSRPGWEVGGDSGAAIVPGDADASLLIDAVRYTEDVIPGMPPDSRLSDDDVALLTKWVNEGAFDPRTQASSPESERATFSVSQRRAEHWSWQPIQNPDLPVVNQTDWPRKSLDHFIAKKLDDAGIVPAEDADDLVWLRRVCFDLTGLPPSLDQIQHFRDLLRTFESRQRAREQVVDELLDSPSFGEKWARHWMDLVRYAETFGHEFDYEIPYAHEYRDYLIRAFNLDVPYDQMIREHVAGDLLERPRRHETESFNESVIATGYWHLHEATHAPTDVLQNEADIAANQIDVFSKTFMGLTVACARCHDHKFDAISTADYYGLFSYLQSSRRIERPLDVHGRGAQIATQAQAIRRDFAERIGVATSDDRSKDAESQWVAPAGTRYIGFEDPELPNGWIVAGTSFGLVPDSPEARLSAGSHKHLPGTIDSSWYGEGAAGTLQSPTFEITSDKIHLRVRSDANQMIRVVIDNFQLAPANALLFRGTLLNGKQTDTKGQWQWKTLGGDLRKYIGQRAYLELIDRGPGSIAVDEIWFAGDGPPTRRAGDETSDSAANDDQAKSAEEALKAACGQWPAPRMVLAMAEGSAIQTPVYIRGSHTNQGDPVPQRNLEALGGRPRTRLELADEIASASNPLTTRVYVNRIWQKLFGKGIVESVDDFGPQGTRPSHPDLLDHLATTFSQDGWSTKRLLRRLVLSRTYGQSVVAHPRNSRQLLSTADPTNRLLHRMTLRRLPAESIRDAILHTAGTLSSDAFGPSVPTHRTAFMSGRGARRSGPLDGHGRRSIYLAVYRNFLNPFLTTFDRPNPFGPKGRRSQSNVPAQSLALMNDPFVIQQADKLGKQLVASAESPDAVIRGLVLRVHASEPSDDQVQSLVRFHQDLVRMHNGSGEAAWKDLVHALWNMKAFTYLR
ncbi:MAG: PSD1 and planctomycete cytochrome C domain-containing protein [Planctomycetota bacterium]